MTTEILELALSLILLASVLLIAGQSLVLMRVVKRLISLGDAIMPTNDNEAAARRAVAAVVEAKRRNPSLFR